MQGPLLLTGAVEEGLTKALRGASPAGKTPVCLVSHDAYRHGAQLLTLELARIFARTFRLELHIVVLGPGPLKPDFRRYGRVYSLTEQQGPAAAALAQRLAGLGVRRALCSSTASGLFVETLSHAGISCIALVHELPGIIAARGFAAHGEAIRACATLTVFPTEAVRDSFPGGAPAASTVRAQGLARRRGPPSPRQRQAARELLQRRHGIPEDAPLILNVGYGDLRKGIDLFVAVGARVAAAHPRARLLWLGAVEPEREAEIGDAIAASGASDRFAFAAFTKDVTPYYAGADLFALTSREDPLPSVLLEAQDAGVPTVAFAGAGGFEPLLRQGGGALVEAGDVDAFARMVLDIVGDGERRARMGAAAVAAVADGYGMRQYAFDLARFLDAAPPRVSVVVPNYNYARYLRGRLTSILEQTLPVYELIVLDDCSTDDSLAVARDVLRRAEADWRILEGEQKATSVFAQWRRGVAAAKGELVWIAEADDLSDRRFLAAATQALADPEVALSYCQSRQIDADGRTLDADYLTYVSDIGAERWRRAYVAEGVDEIRAALAVKNTIPNVSACVFRRSVLHEVLDRHFDEIARFTIAGDWMTYVRALSLGRVAFDPRALNHHRRHGGSVTHSALAPAAAFAEIADMQALVRAEFTPTAQTQAVARAYLEKLRVQFGLAPG